MKATDVVGYDLDGERYCLDCFGDPQQYADEGYGPNPVFAADVDGEDLCGDCRQHLQGD